MTIQHIVRDDLNTVAFSLLRHVDIYLNPKALVGRAQGSQSAAVCTADFQDPASRPN